MARSAHPIGMTTVSWDLPNAPGLVVHVDATVIAGGISYLLMTIGPAGGPGMGGHQSLETFLAQGGLYEMPEDVSAQVRALAVELLSTSRAHVTWTLRAPAILYVSADIDGQTVQISRFDDAAPAEIRLFEGSIAPGTHSFIVLAQWRGADGQVRRHTFRDDREVVAGARVEIAIITE